MNQDRKQSKIFFCNLGNFNLRLLLKMSLENIKKQLSKSQWDTLKKHFNRTGQEIRHGN